VNPSRREPENSITFRNLYARSGRQSTATSQAPKWSRRNQAKIRRAAKIKGKANGHPSDLEPSVTRFCNRSICSGASPSPSDLFCRVHLSCSFWHGPTCRHWFFVLWKMWTGFWMHLTDEAISSSPPRIEPGEAIRIRVISPSLPMWFGFWMHLTDEAISSSLPELSQLPARIVRIDLVASARHFALSPYLPRARPELQIRRV